MRNKRYWRIIATTAIVLILITFTPLVIAPGKTDPKLFSMPYTLWVSILITVLLVLLTYVGGRVHLNDEDIETTNDKTQITNKTQ
ncbi:MAG: hypothetical protein JW761_13220 [Prolixibacteraceae bacterium]|nr:hypothetical protein [Prolixibacteraceae bacterium]